MKIIMTMGDCNGIGIECLVKALASPRIAGMARVDVISICGSAVTIDEYIKKSKLQAAVSGESLTVDGQAFEIIDCGERARVHFGKTSAEAGRLAATAIETALRKVIGNEYQALVTLPISKQAVHLAGWDFPGHTELIAERCGGAKPLMILCHGDVRAALATIHIPLANVEAALSKEHLLEIIKLFNRSLRSDFGCRHPSIAVLALNPHAGEESAIGTGERDFIIPAIEEAAADIIDAHGPYAADGFFAHRSYERYDGYVAMYHDQGLIPLKMLAGWAGVNFTAGLPIVRTSPAHGTAFDIAGKGFAHPESTIDAILTARRIAARRSKSLV